MFPLSRLPITLFHSTMAVVPPNPTREMRKNPREKTHYHKTLFDFILTISDTFPNAQSDDRKFSYTKSEDKNNPL